MAVEIIGDIKEHLNQVISTFLPDAIVAPLFQTFNNHSVHKGEAANFEVLLNNSYFADANNAATYNPSVYFRTSGSDNFYPWNGTTLSNIAEVVFQNLPTDLNTTIKSIRSTYNVLSQLPVLLTKEPVKVFKYGSFTANGTDGFKMDNTTFKLGDSTSLPGFNVNMDDVIHINHVCTNRELLNTTDIFGLTRILYILELLISVRCALLYYSKATTEQEISMRGSIVEVCIIRLGDAHKEFISNSTTTGSMQKVHNNFVTGMQTYNKNTKEVIGLDKDRQNGQKLLKGNIDLIEAQRIITKKRERVERIAVIVASVVVIGCFTVLVTPIEYSYKLLSLIGFVVVALASALTVRALPSLGNTSLEGFDAASSLTSINTSIANYDIVALRYVSYNIADTLMLSSRIYGNNAYGDLNYAMLQEINYYKGINGRLRNAGDKTESYYRMEDLENHKMLATSYFAVNIMLITSVSLTLYVAADNMPTAQPYIIAIGMATALLAITLYLVDVARRVRTDGEKIYWGEPSKV